MSSNVAPAGSLIVFGAMMFTLVVLRFCGAARLSAAERTTEDRS
jgi:hypothetical protein